MYAAVVATILFSFSVVCGGKSAQIIGASAANFWRLALATVWLALWAHSCGSGWQGQAFWLFFWSGIVGFGLGDVAFFQALTRIGSRLTVLLTQCLAAPLAAFVEWIWLQTTLSGWQLIYGAVILTGVCLALAPGGEAKKNRPGFKAGMVFAAIAALGQGLGAVVSRKAFAVAASAGQDIDGGTAAYQRVLGGLLFGGLVYVLIVGRKALLGHRGRSARATDGKAELGSRIKRAWPWVLLNSLAGPAIGVAFYQLALKTTPTGVVLPIVATTPLAVIPFAWYMEGDRPSRPSLVGAAVAVIGAIALARVS